MRKFESDSEVSSDPIYDDCYVIRGAHAENIRSTINIQQI